jgi:hypothetical protein
MDVMVIADDTRILANIIIIDLICVDFVSWTASSQGEIMTIAQAKVLSYHDRYPEDDFILLVVKIFGCLH